MTDHAIIAGSFADEELSIARARLWDHCTPVPEAGCWLWDTTSLRGYGHITFLGTLYRAHRLSWMVHVGPIPDGLHVLHKCDTPSCINPQHLFLGTPLDNAHDREAKGRGNQASGSRHGRHTKPWATCRGDDHPARKHPETKQGVRNGRVKLTEAEVIAIRQSPLGCHRLSKIYPVSENRIKTIRRGDAWKHI